jgi:hypothetical protein
MDALKVPATYNRDPKLFCHSILVL